MMQLLCVSLTEKNVHRLVGRFFFCVVESKIPPSNVAVMFPRQHDREGVHHVGGQAGCTVQAAGRVHHLGEDGGGFTGWQEVQTTLWLLCTPQDC